MGTMATPSPRFPLLAAALLACCSTPNKSLDLARNDRLYVDAAFHSRAPGDRAVFVAPIVDAREPGKLPPRDAGGFPIQYGGDEAWERPVPEMVGEVLERQIAQSGMFASVDRAAAPATLVVQPRLVAFLVGAIERVEGAQALAEVGLQLSVLGPAAADGSRAVLYEHTFGARQLTDPSMKPVSPYLLIGFALRSTMQKALVGLDGSNVGRSHVPAAAALEAAAPAR